MVIYTGGKSVRKGWRGEGGKSVRRTETMPEGDFLMVKKRVELRNLRGRYLDWFLVVKSLSAVKLEGFGFKKLTPKEIF